MTVAGVHTRNPACSGRTESAGFSHAADNTRKEKGAGKTLPAPFCVCRVRLRLVLQEFVHHARIGKGARVTEVAGIACCDLHQHAAHDLATARLG